MTSQKVWFITGTSTGFGREVAKIALKRGDLVIATARKTSAIADLEKDGAKVLALDVQSDQETLNNIAAEAHKLYGRFDILLNMAGYLMEGAVEETSPDEITKIFDVNVFGAVRICNAILPYMRAAKSGVIANVGSIGSWHGAINCGVYCASKGAISLISEAMRDELEKLGVTVTVIEPGYFRTELLTGSNKQKTKNSIQDYDDALGDYRGFLDRVSGKQPGDPVKGSQAIVDLLTQSKTWSGKEIPARVLLGSDAFSFVNKKCHDTIELLSGMKEFVTSTDHDDTKK